MTPTIDFRSDTVTRPTAAMRAAMAAAPVGDDVYGDDPTVNLLQEQVADLTGMAAALFVPSGTQSNLLALFSHCQRGDEYIAGQDAHSYQFEGGGGAVLGSIQPQPVPVLADGSLCLDTVAAVVKPDDPHFARTRLLCLENTISGQLLPAAFLPRAVALARQHGLQVHLDGARLWNAAAASDVPLTSLLEGVDSVSLCLSKGLGAPVGSVLCGDAAFIARARRWRKMLGGGMRQVGILAAAGLYALAHHRDRLQDDHRRAKYLADGLRALGVPVTQHTNMVFLQLDLPGRDSLGAALGTDGILFHARAGRLVTHLDITDADINRTLESAALWAASASEHLTAAMAAADAGQPGYR